MNGEQNYSRVATGFKNVQNFLSPLHLSCLSTAQIMMR